MLVRLEAVVLTVVRLYKSLCQKSLSVMTLGVHDVAGASLDTSAHLADN